jgi:predicted RNA-binding protein YlxR (DUF448 family)
MTAARAGEELDEGPRRAAAAPERSCAATGEVKPVEAMIRFVTDPDGAVVPDLKRRLPGRGVWVTGTRQALGAAITRKAFARGFKREVAARPELIAVTERLLEQAALDALAICHKAGRVAVGFAKVEKALAREPVAALLHAIEASPDGRRKLATALQHRDDASRIQVIDCFVMAQLDLALGRSNVVHAALLAGPESEMLLARTARLHRFRSGPMPGLPALGKDRTRAAARRRHESVTRRDTTPGKRKPDWDGNG